MVTPSASVEPMLSITEVIDGIKHLSNANALRFKKASEYLSFGGARPPADLRNEAIRRVAAGTRNCPRNIPIVVFLFGVMRSIASADRKAIKRAPKFAIVPKDDSAAANLLDGADPRLSPEDRMIQEEALAELKNTVLNLFEADVETQTLVEGLMDGMEGQRAPRARGTE
jgi:RNA polymerase sigma-70 factor (ECF subfamily)